MTRLFCICVLVITAGFAVFNAIACLELDRQPGRITSPQPYSKPRQKCRVFLHFNLRKRTGLLSTYRVCIVIFLPCYGDEKTKGI